MFIDSSFCLFFYFVLQNSIRHNLSLHSRFIRVQNEGTGKSSWWMINPEGGKGGKAPRRRAVSMDNSNKYTKSARGRAAKKKAALQAAAAAAGEGGGDSPSGLSRWPGSPTSHSTEDLDSGWTDFRSRTNSNASTVSGRLSPILANTELGEVLDDEAPLSPMIYSSPGRALSPGNAMSNGKAAPAELPRLADLTGTMNLNDGITDELMDDLLDNIKLVPPSTSQNLQNGFTFGSKPNGISLPSSTSCPSSNSSSNGGNNGFSNSIFGSQAIGSLRSSPMQTIQENKQTSFTSISMSGFGTKTLQDLLNSGSHNHSDVMMTQSDPLMSQASSAAVNSQNSRRGLILRNDPVMTFGTGGGIQGSQRDVLQTNNQNQSSVRSINGGLNLANEANTLANAKQQLLLSPLGGNGSSTMQIDPSIFLNGTISSSSGGGVSQDRFPTDLDLDIFNGSLECDMDSIIRNDLMDADGLDFNFDSLVNMNGVSNFTSTKQSSQSWVPG